MNDTSKMTQTGSENPNTSESYNADSDLVDFILGITFEIWEQGQIEKIYDYYAENVEVHSLEGITSSAAIMVENTHTTLSVFPDRLLLADDVITSGTTKQGFSSHRIVSPMSNLGPSAFGPATGLRVQTMNIADCEVNDGLITNEWLVRDNLALIRQLGFDPVACASIVAQKFDEQQSAWLASEYSRTVNNDTAASSKAQNDPAYGFALDVLKNCWQLGDRSTLEAAYHPYCVLKRAPLQIYSGRDRILKHYADWRNAFPGASLSIDNVCSQSFDQHNQRIAVRWSVAGVHEGEFAKTPGTGKQIYILGVTHWQVVDGRITHEWTVFDELAVLAQTLI